VYSGYPMFAAGASDQPPNSCQDGPGRASKGLDRRAFGFLVIVANPTIFLSDGVDLSLYQRWANSVSVEIHLKIHPDQMTKPTSCSHNEGLHDSGYTARRSWDWLGREQSSCAICACWLGAHGIIPPHPLRWTTC